MRSGSSGASSSGCLLAWLVLPYATLSASGAASSRHRSSSSRGRRSCPCPSRSRRCSWRSWRSSPARSRSGGSAASCAPGRPERGLARDVAPPAARRSGRGARADRPRAHHGVRLRGRSAPARPGRRSCAARRGGRRASLGSGHPARPGAPDRAGRGRPARSGGRGRRRAPGAGPPGGERAVRRPGVQRPTLRAGGSPPTPGRRACSRCASSRTWAITSGTSPAARRRVRSRQCSRRGPPRAAWPAWLARWRCRRTRPRRWAWSSATPSSSSPTRRTRWGGATTTMPPRSSSGSSRSPQPDDPYWSDDTTLERPTTRALTADLVFVNAIALLAPDAYPELMSATEAGGLPMRYAWRYQVDPRRLASGERRRRARRPAPARERLPGVGRRERRGQGHDPPDRAPRVHRHAAGALAIGRGRPDRGRDRAGGGRRRGTRPRRPARLGPAPGRPGAVTRARGIGGADRRGDGR